MPTISVTAPAGSLDVSARDTLVRRLSDALLKAEGADVGNVAAQAIAWTYFNEVPPGLLYVGGQPAQEPRFKIEVTTPAGALDDETRGRLAAEIGSIVEDEVGAAGAGFNHWVLFNEIREGGWATAGRVFRRADIVAAVRGSQIGSN